MSRRLPVSFTVAAGVVNLLQAPVSVDLRI